MQLNSVLEQQTAVVLYLVHVCSLTSLFLSAVRLSDLTSLK